MHLTFYDIIKFASRSMTSAEYFNENSGHVIKTSSRGANGSAHRQFQRFSGNSGGLCPRFISLELADFQRRLASVEKRNENFLPRKAVKRRGKGLFSSFIRI